MKELALLFFMLLGLELIICLSLVYLFAKLRKKSCGASCGALIVLYSLACFFLYKYNIGIQSLSRGLGWFFFRLQELREFHNHTFSLRLDEAFSRLLFFLRSMPGFLPLLPAVWLCGAAAGAYLYFSGRALPEGRFLPAGAVKAGCASDCIVFLGAKSSPSESFSGRLRFDVLII